MACLQLTGMYCSLGDYDGRGKLRKEELYRSCQVLGIKKENVILLRYAILRHCGLSNGISRSVKRLYFALRANRHLSMTAPPERYLYLGVYSYWRLLRF